MAAIQWAFLNHPLQFLTLDREKLIIHYGKCSFLCSFLDDFTLTMSCQTCFPLLEKGLKFSVLHSVTEVYEIGEPQKEKMGEI